jgi:hypothetical protein
MRLLALSIKILLDFDEAVANSGANYLIVCYTIVFQLTGILFSFFYGLLQVVFCKFCGGGVDGVLDTGGGGDPVGIGVNGGGAGLADVMGVSGGSGEA